jgi:hypothetical protein
MTRDLGLLKTAAGSDTEFGTSKGGTVMDQDRGLRGLRKQRVVSEKRMRLWAAILAFGAAVAALDDNVASADEGIIKGPLRLKYLVTEDERTVAIWGSGISEEPPENVTGNKVLLPVPAELAARIESIVSNPAGFPDGILEYVIVLRGGSSVRICHTQNGQFHCHPPN